MKIKYFLSIVIILFGCSNGDHLTISSQSYNLIGEVKSVSEKRIPITIDDKWNWEIDVAKASNVITDGRYFDNKGRLIEIRYYTKDSILNSLSKFRHSTSGVYKGTQQYDAKEDLINETRIVNASQEYLETEIYDYKKKKIIARQETFYKNGIMIKTSSQNLVNNSESIFEFIRDEKGNETELIWSFKNNDGQITYKYEMRYIEFDQHGNWISRIQYLPENKSEGVLVKREIDYY